MNDNSELIPESENMLILFRDCINLVSRTKNIISEELDSVKNISNAQNMIPELDSLVNAANRFFKIYDEIVECRESFNPTILKAYHETVSVCFESNLTPLTQLNKVCKNIVNTNSVSDEMIQDLITLIPNLSIMFNILNNLHTILHSTRANPPQTLTYEVAAIEETGFVADAFLQYIAIAKYTDENESVFKSISSEIRKITEEVYAKQIRPNFPETSTFATITGPSLMGKTQFAFSLARFSPVFYVNFASESDSQEIYKAFAKMSFIFIICLKNDVETLKKAKVELGAGSLKEDGLNIKLETVGLLWQLVDYSTEFEFDGSAEWFEHYLAARSIKFEKMSIYEYLKKLGKP